MSDESNEAQPAGTVGRGEIPSAVFALCKLSVGISAVNSELWEAEQRQKMDFSHNKTKLWFSGARSKERFPLLLALSPVQ